MSRSDNSIKNIVNRKFICYNIVQIGGNRKDGIMLVTQQVTCGAKGGGDYGKCEPVEILHGKGRIYAERAGKIARNL